MTSLKITHVEEDLTSTGLGAYIVRRYPIRFVLFNNFRDSFQFVKELQNKFKIHVESVDSWLNEDCDDEMITHSKLAERIKSYINSSVRSSVIAPFSELARFYDNRDENAEFRALITTIRGIEALGEAKGNQRIYIPIVGLEGKMAPFQKDNQTFIWNYSSLDIGSNYRLILTKETYGVNDLDSCFTHVPDIKNWLKIWRTPNALPNIISTSKKIYANSEYAQPDNAFSFCKCENGYEFLVNGLKLDFGDIIYNHKDEEQWQKLAAEINIVNFSFKEFVTSYFQTHIKNYSSFISSWFKRDDKFSRWLLTTYYSSISDQNDYVNVIVKNLHNYTDRDFFSNAALCIFDLENKEDFIEERFKCLRAAKEHGISLSDNVQTKLLKKLNLLAEEHGYTTASRYLSSLTNVEKALIINWLTKQLISLDSIEPFYPELYHYLGKETANENQQIQEYIETYKYAKIYNSYTPEIEERINNINISVQSFNQWYQCYKTTRTILNDRKDIEKYYWIDGLGADWIPFISWLVNSKRNAGVFLNEVFIAKANLPTTTEVNKQDLELITDSLHKIGDLDSFAHTHKKYPSSIIDEMSIVKEAVQNILAEYSGGKIAIISDHGLTALSQLRDGLNLAGVKSDHNGRLATRTGNTPISSTNNNYYVVDNNKLCALRHESLCGKIPAGQNAHGGCTPEEVLSPIFIISDQPNATNWNAVLIDNEIKGTNPVVQYRINGISQSDIPYVLYNGKRYSLINQEENIFTSGKLDLSSDINEIILCIGQTKQTSHLKIGLGAQEEDLFSF